MDTAEIEIIVKEIGLDQTNNRLSTLEQTVAKVETSVGTMGDGFTRAAANVVTLSAALSLVQRGLSTLESVFGRVYEASTGQENATARLNAVLIAQGRYSDAYTTQLHAQAEALSRTTVYSREQLTSVQALLATFPRLSTDLLPRAVATTTDLATAMNLGSSASGNLLQAARQLGFALDNPERGFMRLQRAGIGFTDQQKAMVKQLEETGHGVQAQVYLLDLLAERLGGEASARAQTFEGRLEVLGNALERLYTALGDIVTQSDPAKNAISDLSASTDDATSSTVDWTVKNRDAIDSAIQWVRTFQGPFAGPSEQMKDLASDTALVSEALGIAKIATEQWAQQLAGLQVFTNTTTGESIFGAGGITTLGELGNAARTLFDRFAAFTGLNEPKSTVDALSASLEAHVPFVKSVVEYWQELRQTWLESQAAGAFVREEIERMAEMRPETLFQPKGFEVVGPFAAMMTKPGPTQTQPDFGEKGAKTAKSWLDALDPMKDAQREIEALIKSLDRSSDPLQNYQNEIKALDQAYASGKISTELYNRAVDQLTHTLLMGKGFDAAQLAQAKRWEAEGKRLVDQSETATEKYERETAGIIALGNTYDVITGTMVLSTDQVSRALEDLDRREQAQYKTLLDSVNPTHALADAYDALQRKIADAAGVGVVFSPDDVKRAYAKAYDDWMKSTDSGYNQLLQATERFGQTFSQDFAAMLAHNKVNWDQFLTSLVQSIDEMFIQTLLTKPLLGFLRGAVLEPLQQLGGGGGVSFEQQAIEFGRSLWGAGLPPSGFETTQQPIQGPPQEGQSAVESIGLQVGTPLVSKELTNEIQANFRSMIDNVEKDFSAIFTTLGTSLTSLFDSLTSGGGPSLSGFGTAILGALPYIGKAFQGGGGGGGSDFGSGVGGILDTGGGGYSSAPIASVGDLRATAAYTQRAPERAPAMVVHASAPTTIIVQSLDPRGAAQVIQQQMPVIVRGVQRAVEAGGSFSAAVGRRRGSQ